MPPWLRQSTPGHLGEIAADEGPDAQRPARIARRVVPGAAATANWTPRAPSEPFAEPPDEPSPGFHTFQYAQLLGQGQ
jgi:hypothetical protein